MPNFPTSLDALANPTATTLRNDPGFELHQAISTLNDIAEALEAKLGIGASTPGATASVLRRTAAGASAWGQVTAADIAPGAQLALLGSVGPVVSNTASFDFTGISQSYKALRLLVQGRSTTTALSDVVSLRVNNVSTAFYYSQSVTNTGSTVTGNEEVGASLHNLCIVAGNTAAGGALGGCVVDFPNYALPATLVRLWHTVGGASWGVTPGLGQAKTGFGVLFQASAITQLTLAPSGGQFMPGSFAALYGMP